MERGRGVGRWDEKGAPGTGEMEETNTMQEKTRWEVRTNNVDD